MSSVKITDKELLERLSAQIFLQTGRKFTQQELLTLCVQFSSENIDDFMAKISVGSRIWTSKEINALAKRYSSDFGENTKTRISSAPQPIVGESLLVSFLLSSDNWTSQSGNYSQIRRKSR